MTNTAKTTNSSETENLNEANEYASYIDAGLEAQLKHIEDLSFTFKKILVKYNDALSKNGTKEKIEKLERWAESYRKGLHAAQRLSEFGNVWLAEVKEELKLAADELIRLEEEGGNVATKKEKNLSEQLIKANEAIDKIIPKVDETLKANVSTDIAACAEEKPEDCNKSSLVS